MERRKRHIHIANFYSCKYPDSSSPSLFIISSKCSSIDCWKISFSVHGRFCFRKKKNLTPPPTHLWELKEREKGTYFFLFSFTLRKSLNIVLKFWFLREEEGREKMGSSSMVKKKERNPELVNIVFSWSIDDIMNNDLYRFQVNFSWLLIHILWCK